MRRAALLLVLAASCGRGGDVDAPQTLLLSSPDIAGEIPAAFAKAAPRWAWSNLPAGTKELALVVDDPDAPTAEPYVHYVLTRLSPTEGGTPPVVGKNESGKTEWEPLDPPKGETHAYRFRLYALDASLGASPLSKAELLAAMRGHVLAWGEFRARYPARK